MNRKFDWAKTGFIAVLVLGTVAVAGLAYAAGDEHGGGMDKVKDLWLRIMNFAGLVVILVWALKKPIANGLNSRRQAIRDQFDDLDARRGEAERLYKEYEAKLSSIDVEVKSIIDAAVAQGEAEKQKIIDEANRVAGDIKRQAEMAVQHELTMATQRLRQEVAEQAVVMAEEIIKKNLKADDQVRLVEGYLDKVGGVQ
jgi:F-type H+-transporting ATPase subunit b